MININQTSEQTKILIPRSNINGDIEKNNYVTEDELQEILKGYNSIPYLFIKYEYPNNVIYGDFDRVVEAIENNKPYLIYTPYLDYANTYIQPTTVTYNKNTNTITANSFIHSEVDRIQKLYYTISSNNVTSGNDILFVQPKLVSGENIKTINGNDILGEGDIKIDVDLTGYATEQWVDDKGYLKEIPEEYVTETELNDALANVGNGNIVELTQSEYNGITPEPDTLYVISDAPAVEIPDTSEFATVTYVDEQIGNINNILENIIG